MATGKQYAILGATSVISLGVGAASGWFLAKRILTVQFEERLEKELEETKVFYSNLNKPDPEWLAEQLLAPEDLQPRSQYDTTSDEVPPEILERIANKMAAAEAEVAEEAEPIREELPHNAFDNPAPAWVQEDEELERKNGVPYIISQEEFLENQWEFEEGQLIYYAGDDTLADSRDEAIPNHYAYVGEKALDHFGFGSNDPNIVYVCNEKNEMILEISQSTKSYSEDVLGFQHADGPRRMREEWDG